MIGQGSRGLLEPGSPTAVLIGRWGAALSLIAGAVLIGRVIRDFPYLLPNRLPGLVIYELGPSLVLGVAIGAAIIITRNSGPRFGASTRLGLFALFALVARRRHPRLRVQRGPAGPMAMTDGADLCHVAHPDMDLARTLAANARGFFCDRFDARDDRQLQDRFHRLAIVLELALKSYLLFAAIPTRRTGASATIYYVLLTLRRARG